ncbi:hypothetical protein GCM10011613_31910 [Cellvibrio zantedeschiae]|uniref:Uncharacterized protein n=1 Tax=Cellvibrio zantedeschiae TaxID=1237077 RepID=A0ABQ3B8N0_9GAMM|nr:hypothetical protein [Cellvibrio zantedeschiae]GGY84570.1 hypothetical protein GCM10011613_31910 [Cellvibrio zantedeschiae]
MQMTEPLFNPANYQRLLGFSNFCLSLSVLVLVTTVLICYPFAEFLSISQLVASHLCLICSATLLKLSYIGRCVARHGLKLEVL